MKNILLIYLTLVVQSIFNLAFGQNDYYQEDKWPNLKFILPVAMHTAPDNSKRIFVIEQNGRIKVFKDSGNVGANDTSTFLNLRNRLPNGNGNETGLLGMAFHPNFSQNGHVYIDYTTNTNPVTTYISRFKLDSLNPNKLNTASEKRILQVPQPYSNHNGGSIVFGDDGYLYVTMGDGGSSGDPGNRAQNKSELLGKILRIDVNVPENGPAYAIPPDNPLVNNIQNWKKEIYAWGFRNPWKITKDHQQTTIWIGDVGQGAFEEIDTLRKGANYGWKILEGNAAFSPCNGCDTSNLEWPLATYGRSLGVSVTGGYVYRGSELVNLKGSYFYADFSSQRVWNLKKGIDGKYKNTLIPIGTPSGPISSFGLDYENELYTVRYSATNGKLLKLRCGPQTPILANPLKASVCIGDSIVMQAPSLPGVVGYKWSTGDTTMNIVLKQVGSYNVSLQTRNALGCWSYISGSIILKVKPLPQKPVIGDLSSCFGENASISLPATNLYAWSADGNENRFSTETGGKFWVIASDSIGCKSDTSYFKVSINPTPQKPEISNFIACFGDTISATLPSKYAYSWSSGGNLNLFSSAIAGQYWVMSTDSNACKSDTSYFGITLIPLPDTPIITIIGDEVTTSPIPGASYDWFKDSTFIETTTIPSLTTSLDGIYTLVITSAQGCKSQMSLPSTLVSISKTEISESSIVLKPNPVNDQLSISIKSRKTERIADYEIYDLIGKSIFGGQFDLNNTKGDYFVDVKNWPKGIYLLKIKIAGKSFSKRLMKN